MTSLPLTHGSLLIDNTYIEHSQECSRLCELVEFKRRIPAAVKMGASFGTAVHLALDHRYRAFGTDLDPLTSIECLDGQSAILQRYFELYPPSEGDHRHLNWAIDLMRAYNDKYNIEPFNLVKGPDGKAMVELPFMIFFGVLNTDTGLISRNLTLEAARACPSRCSKDTTLPLYVPIFYVGKIDLPTLWNGNGLWIGDHKTAGRLGADHFDEYRVSPQQVGYAWAWWKTTGLMPTGFWINSIRTSAMPAKPKAGIAAWWEECFQRNKERVDLGLFQEWEHNLYALMEEGFWHWQRGYFPMKRKWCVGKYGKCGFYELCYSPAKERDELLRYSAAFTDNTWSPLNDPLKKGQE